MENKRTVHLWHQGRFIKTSLEYHEKILCTTSFVEMEFLLDHEGTNVIIEGDTIHIFYDVEWTGYPTFDSQVGYRVPIHYTGHEIIEEVYCAP